MLEDEGVYKTWYIAAESTVEEIDNGRIFRLCYGSPRTELIGVMEYEGNERNNMCT